MLKKSILLMILLFSFLFSEDNSIKKEIPSVVPIKWLKDNIDNKRLVILDIREYEEYKKGHLKGAINIPGLQSLFDANSWMMPKLDFLKELFSNAGIDKDSLVVAYDNGQFFWAARAYWILEVLGHHNVGILEYSYGNYLKNNLPISKEDTIASKKDFIPRVDTKQIATKLSTLLSIGKDTIIDGRASSHYEGKDSIAKRYGHIPTAMNYACTNTFQVTKDGSKMKDFKELEKIYKDVPKDKNIILYCDGGAESALNYIVLKKLGFKASVYDGSWKEWGNDSSVPVTNPSKDKK